MRLSVFRSLLVLTAAFLIVSPVQADDFPFTDQTSPLNLLTAYYNAINLRDYTRAYGYWRNPPDDQTLDQFAAGFAGTDRVDVIARLPIMSEGAAGSIFASIPAMLLATTNDNATPPTYVACFVARKSNVPEGNNPEPDPNWHLYSADVYSVSIENLDLLDNVCENSTPIAEMGVYENRLTPEDLLTAYYNAIVLQDYARAYDYWSAPLDQTLEQFSAGFSDVADIEIYVHLAGLSEGAAGTIYSTLPVLLNVTRRAGDPQYFIGCFVMRRSNVPVGDAVEPDPNWSIYSADLNADPLAGIFARSLLDLECAP